MQIFAEMLVYIKQYIFLAILLNMLDSILDYKNGNCKIANFNPFMQIFAEIYSLYQQTHISIRITETSKIKYLTANEDFKF